MTDGALAGVRVIDAATLAAGPLIATWMAEHGAEVIKVEQPDGGDPLRQWGAQREGIGLMWKSVARNKKCVTLNLRLEAGRDLLRSLARQADVVIVNLRPSTLRDWGLEYGNLAAANPRLVMVHVTGYGAGGPKSDWPGFGTLGEAMSGFAHLTGTPDGPPTLPSFMLADGVAALTATYAVMMALYHRDTHGGQDGGRGQLIDINLIEPLARLLEQSVLTYDQLGTIPVRTGNRWDISAPRNTYKTSDGRWLAMSGSAPTIAMRALRAVGRADLTADPKFAEAQQRLRNAAEIDAIMADWIGQRTLDAALAVFEEAGVAAAPIYDAEQLTDDPQLRARGVYQSVPDPDLGSMRVQAPVPRFSATPGRISHLGPRLGEHNAEVYREFLGLDAERLRELSEQGVILVAAKPRPRRSELATPASNDDMFAKAAAAGADLVFLDLEDACAPAEREKARGKAARALRDLDWGRTARAIRINGIDTRWAYGDIIEVVTTAREALDVIIVPKVRRARDVWWVDVLLTQLEETLGLRKRVALEVLIEETEGLQHVDEIAAASDRLEAIIFGAGDFSASQGARVDTNFDPVVDMPGDIWHYARARILVAARTAGIDAIDAPFPNYKDPGAYRIACDRAAAMGFVGKWAIHPGQVEVANAAFSPTAEEIAHAERLVAAYRAAESAGKGAAGLDGMLVDAAHLRHAAAVAGRAELLGLSGKGAPA